MAESRYYARKQVRETDNCAALVGWSFHEALLPHNAAWAKSTDLPLFPAMPSVEEITGRQVPFADASALQRDETWFVSRDLSVAKPADLLFFKAGSLEHVMIYIGSSQIVPSAENGSSMWRIAATLASWPAEWRAQPSNASFLGVWRFNILRDSK